MKREFAGCWQFWISTAVARKHPTLAPDLARAAERVPPMGPPMPDPSTPSARVEANLKALAIVDRQARGTLFDLLAYSGWGGLGDEWARLPLALRDRISRDELIASYYTPHAVAFEMARLALLHLPKTARTVLDPAAGSGRLLFPFAFSGFALTAIELQQASVDVLDRWRNVVTPTMAVYSGPLERHVATLDEKFDCIISNPPYGERPFREHDPSYRAITRSHLYFLQRSMTLLSEDGVGVFLMPDGFLAGSQARADRESWLTTAELLDAWQLPARLFPGAALNVTVMVFRRRRGSLSPSDEAIAAGRYFELHPERIQGTAAGGSGRWGGLREGAFVCLGAPSASPPEQEPEAGTLERAESLVRRLDRGLAWQIDVAEVQRAGGTHPNLPRVAEPHVPAVFRAEREWARTFAPVQAPLDGDELAAEGWRQLGGGWVPPRLWGVLSSLVPLLSTPDAPAWLREELGARQVVPATVADTVSWRAPYVPLRVLMAWLRSTPGGESAVVLRVDGVLAVRGHPWGTYLMAEINGDPSLWPRKIDRNEVLAGLDQSWSAFREQQPWRGVIVQAYARTFRAVFPVETSDAPEKLERWNFAYRSPHTYQWAEARRAATVRRALTGFAVGLGKTLTAILTWLLLRNKGEARRTLVIVPSSTLPGWVSTWRGAVPDVRLQTIGDADTKERRRTKFRALADFEVTIATRDAAKALPVDRDVAVAVVLGDLAMSKEVFGGGGGTERELAKSAATARAFLDVKLRNEDPELPTLAMLGADHVIVDEAQNYSNLYAPPIIDGEKTPIAYIGGADQQSQRAWSLVLGIRSLAAQGQASVHALTATPAQNGPLDLYAVSAILGNPWPQKNPRAWLHDYARIERSLKERASGSVEMVAAVVGFKREPEFFAYLDFFARFATAESVGLPLPEVQAERILVPANSVELDVLLGLITTLAEAAKKHQMGTLRSMYTKLNMAAVHVELLSDPPPKRAAPSSKMTAIMERVGKTCGHIVFLEFTHAQRWLADAMREQGLLVEILSGEVSIAERARIRDRFNTGKIDVVIVGGVGQEGVDLQTRTCTLHHMDIPWTPTRLEQRNGRGVRQGAGAKVIAIYYYLLTPSADSLRLQVVIGKGTALAQLIQKKATNNPAAESDLPLAAILREASMHAAEFDRVLKDIEADRSGAEAKRAEADRAMQVREARQRVATGLDTTIADDVPVLFPSERWALLNPQAVLLVEQSGRSWWAAPGDAVVHKSELKFLSVVDHPTEGTWIVLRQAGTLEIETFRPRDVILAEPAAGAPEDEEALWEAGGGNERWALLPPDLVARLWTRGAPPAREGSRARPRIRDGRLVSEGDGPIVAPTEEGWRAAAAADYAVSRWFLDEGWALWWPRPLPRRPTREERLIFESRRSGETSDAAFDAVFRPIRATWQTLLDPDAVLQLPYGLRDDYPEGTKLPGPGLLESSAPSRVTPGDLRYNASIFRAQVSVESQTITPGVVADAILLPDGLWRAAVRDAAETQRWMWVGGDGLTSADAAHTVAAAAFQGAARQVEAGERFQTRISGRLAVATIAQDLFVDTMVVGILDEQVYVAAGSPHRLDGRVIGRAAMGHVHHGVTATGLAELFAENEDGGEANLVISEKNPGVLSLGANSVRTTKPPFAIGRTQHTVRVQGAEAVAWLAQEWDKVLFLPGRIDAFRQARGIRAVLPVDYTGPVLEIGTRAAEIAHRFDELPATLVLRVHEPKDTQIAVSMAAPFWVANGSIRQALEAPEIEWVLDLSVETVHLLQAWLAAISSEFVTLEHDGRGVRVRPSVGKKKAEAAPQPAQEMPLPGAPGGEPFRRTVMGEPFRDRLRSAALAKVGLRLGTFGAWGAALGTTVLVTVFGGLKE